MDILTDFGEWKVPMTWSDVTLKQLEEIQRLYADEEEKHVNIIDIMPILTNHTKEEIEALPIDFVEAIMTEMSFLLAPLPKTEPNASVTFNGETYTVNIKEKMTTGEFVATQMALQADPYDYAAVLAVIARKEGEKYDSKFENEVLAERKQLWESMPAVAVMPLIAFFLRISEILEAHSALYSMADTALKNLEAQLGETSLKGGVGKAYSIWRQRRIFRKLRKSLNQISSTFFNGEATK